jgi:hypothetical protein
VLICAVILSLSIVHSGGTDFMKAEALNWLEKHMSSRAETASAYAVSPQLDDLRFDPRFKEMLKRMNLPQ